MILSWLKMTRVIYKPHAHTHFFNAVVEEGQTGVFVADKCTFFDEADKNLSLGELRVELLVSAVSTLQES